MSTGYKIDEKDGIYFLTFQIVEWVDIFTRKIYRDLVLESLNYCMNSKGLVIYAFVIMSNHIHLLAESKTEDLSGTIRDFKKFTSKKIIEIIESGGESRERWMLSIFKKATLKHSHNKNYQVWTRENHAELIYSEKFIDQKLDYIHENPVRSGWVVRPEDYVYSSASNYIDGSGVLNVEVMYQRWKTYT